MNVLHVITSMGVNWGGPALTTLLTVRGLRNTNVNASVLTYIPQAGDRLISQEPFIHCLPSLSPFQRMSAWSVEMRQKAKIVRPDLFHIQGLWQYPGYIMSETAYKKQVPYIITLHGQLYPQALSLSSWKKKAALFLFQRQQLQHASCVHVTCVEEMLHYRALGFMNPVAVIPNPVDSINKEIYSHIDSVKRIGYLGRIHQRKNVHLLIEAWAKLGEKEGRLLIMGSGERAYMRLLHAKVKQLGLTNVFFTGFVTGYKKQQLLASLSCLVVPSDFENFGMIIPEALLQNIPVIASKGTPWEALNTHNCGWWIDNDVDTLVYTIRRVLALDEQTRFEMGLRGRILVQQNYSVERVASQMKHLYEWLQGNASKPDFVYTV